MKNVMRLLCAAMLLVSFAACTEKENQEPSDTTGNGGNDNNNYSTLILGTWQVNDMSVDGVYSLPYERMMLSFYEDGSGLMDDGDASHHNDFTWAISGSTTTVTTDHHQFTFIIDEIDETGCRFHSSYVEFVDGQAINGDIRFFMTKIPDNPDPGDLGIGTPDLWESTETSLTIHAHVTGSVSQYLWQYPFYTCGLIWCPASEGTPTMNSNIYTSGGDDIYYVIEGLTPGTEYNVAAWLKLTPDSEPIISEVRTYTTENGGSQPGDTNWINLVDAVFESNTTLSFTVTAYFDGDPIGLGIVYNTTGNPTLNDNVYNGFDHVNLETGETDGTILHMQENPDGSRTVTALLTDLQPGTTYHLRGYMQFSGSTPTLYSNQELTVTTPAE